MIKKTVAVVAAFGLVGVLVAPTASAGNRFGVNGEKVKGHVIKVEQQTRTGNDGELTRLTIRTRNGEEMQLHLGNSENCQGCVQVGDQIQARLQGKQGPQGERQVQSMKVRRSGEMFGLQSNGNGSMVRNSGGLGAGKGAGQQDTNQVRTRLKDGSNCQSKGLRSGSGGQNAGGGSRGGGGGGGGGRG